MFAQVIYYSLLYPLVSTKLTPDVPSTRVETFLQVVLHLVLIAIVEDTTDDDTMAEDSPVSLMLTKDEFKACHKKLIFILKRMKQKRPETFEKAYTALGIPVDRVNTSSPAINSAEVEKERKKKATLSRQAKVMA